MYSVLDKDLQLLVQSGTGCITVHLQKGSRSTLVEFQAGPLSFKATRNGEAVGELLGKTVEGQDGVIRRWNYNHWTGKISISRLE